MKAEDLKPIGTVNGRIVIELDREITEEGLERLRAAATEAFGTDKLAILTVGVRLANLSEERLDRIEAKLDRLLESAQPRWFGGPR